MKMLPFALLIALHGVTLTASADSCTIYINSVAHNVGVYHCDTNGICVLTSSHFDPDAESIPLQADEEEIDLGPASLNSVNNSQNQKAISLLNNCLDPGNGGGGSSGTPTLPPVIATAPRPRERIVSIRPFYRPGGNGGSGGVGNSSNRAAREQKRVQLENALCGSPVEVRQVEAARAISNANNGAMPPSGTRFTGITSDGYEEMWMVGNPASSGAAVGLVYSECPGSGNG